MNQNQSRSGQTLDTLRGKNREYNQIIFDEDKILYLLQRYGSDVVIDILTREHENINIFSNKKFYEKLLTTILKKDYVFKIPDKLAKLLDIFEKNYNLRPKYDRNNEPITNESNCLDKEYCCCCCAVLWYCLATCCEAAGEIMEIFSRD